MEVINKRYKIRPIFKEDLDSVFTMLVDLVKHEGIIKRFQLTKERLNDELFGVNADWNCLVAADPCESVIGFCFYSFANINRAFNLSSMIQIDDIYVSPLYRNSGVGNRLLQELALIAKSRGILRFNVWCVKDNEQGQKFYQKIGGEKLDFVDVYAIQVTKLLNEGLDERAIEGASL
jgi:ribosomal protein S18 acetylase RimI-like enzyme